VTQQWLRPHPVSRNNSVSLLAGGGLRGAGGGGDHPPLEDAGVLPAHGEEVGVAVGEADVGDVAAVALVLVARRLEEEEEEEEEDEEEEEEATLFMSTLERTQAE